MVAASAVRIRIPTPWTLDVVEQHHAGAEDDLERQQLERDRGRLAQEDRRAVEPGEPEPVPGVVLLLGREGPPDRQQRGQQDRDPEQARARPGPGSRGPGPGRRRTAGSRSGRTAGSGRSPTRDRDSIRRSLPTTSPASRQTLMRQRRRSDGTDGGPAGVDADLAGGQGAGEVELVGGHEDGPALGRRRGHDLVQDLAAVGVEAGVGLVEQQERGSRTSAAPSARRRRWPAESFAVGQVGHRAEAEPLDRRARRRRPSPPDARATKRRFSRTVRSS